MTNHRALQTPDDLIAERLEMIRASVAELGRRDVEVVAVTKGFDSSAVCAARRLGLASVGENYAQELVEKAEDLTDLHVSFLGRIQRNKVRKIAHLVDLWQSVARLEILEEIAKRSPGASVLVQIQPEGDDSKDGVRPASIPEFFERAETLGIEIAGFMTIGVNGDDRRTEQCFREVDALATEYGLAVRSMGMSNDYRIALASGSTMLRLGSVLFGERPR